MATSRSTWAAVGAAVAVTLGAGGFGLASATTPSDATAYVPITPCRAADTRPAPDTKGDRSTPLGSAETHPVSVDDADCNGQVPSTASGVQLNVTATGATLGTFLTIWGAGDLPDASNLNPTPDAPPTPNAVTTGLDGDTFNIYNYQGEVDVIVDIVGYYTDHHHDDRYYTEAETDQLIADSMPDLPAPLPAPVQDIVDIDPDYLDSGGSTYLNIEVDTVDPVIANTINLTLPDVCPGTDEYDVVLTASGHLHYDSNEGIDAELELEVNDVTDFRANLEIQLDPPGDLLPEIPYSRTVLLTLDAGTHKLEWTAEKEYLSSDSFNVRNPIMVAQPTAHRCP